ncbi:GNAT family N-acetyltransferase [Vibrio sp. Of14-4]|uniref:GNAT family N-acetyltransferase n=1 Tax=Vibrio sp. Of14-4 TaxID=2724878 RepID=UPI001EF19C52|nr:GNAT family N-acetyltransferase [Vibrio sp. Of14-4]
MHDEIIIASNQNKFLPTLKQIYLASRTTTFKWLDSKQFCLADFDIDVEGEQIWVALCKGKPVGFISVWEPENFIHHLYISPEYTRKGIGARLLEFVKPRYTSLSLKCMQPNKSALNFYQSHGFISQSQHMDEFGGYHYLTYEE